MRVPAKVSGSGGLDADAAADVGQGGGDGGEVELFGLVLGVLDEQGLEVGDSASDLGGVEAVAVGQQLGGLCGGQDIRGQEPIQRGRGGVVEAGAAAVAVGAVSDRFLGRASRFRGHSYVRHRTCFAGSFRESRRRLDKHDASGHTSRRLLQ